jgi:flagellar protein FlaI
VILLAKQEKNPKKATDSSGKKLELEKKRDSLANKPKKKLILKEKKEKPREKGGFFGGLLSKNKKSKIIHKDKEKKKPKPKCEIIESYWMHNSLAKVNICDEDGQLKYVVEEADLSPREEEVYKKIVSLITKELTSPESMVGELNTYILSEAKRLARKYKRTLGKFKAESWEKIYYFVIRDLAGYGDLDVLMNDPNIEDVSCNGLNKPIYIWHRKYESIPTNIEFIQESDYDNFIVKLAHMGDKHISSAHPMLDAMLPGRHRLAATFRREVSTFGSSFCVRKFREDPFSIVDLIDIGTVDAALAAYFWVLLENKMSMMVIGGTGAGKTSTLNALISLIMPNDKIVTVEEIAELNTLHDNWVQLTSRRGFRFGQADETSISLFDLVKLSLRYRPDYIIVGEIRGEEAYALFQAVATGHGGICTMHADSFDNAAKRLTSEPMNVAEVYVPLMNVGLYVSRVELPKKKMGLAFGRRVRNVWEIIEYGKYNLISEWDPVEDVFHTKFDKSLLLDQIATKKGLSKNDLIEEIKHREEIMNDVLKSGKRSQKDVTDAITDYYNEAREEKMNGKRRKAKPKLQPPLEASPRTYTAYKERNMFA